MEPSPDDGLVFPNEPGFTGFPSILPADAVTYEIRLLDSNVSETELRDELRTIQSTATQLTRKLLKGYIWQREVFRLDLAKEHGRSLLRGRTDFGDSIEDEWLIVYLLRHLSQQFKSAWIRVTDADGEFLLVEAANALPKWLNPDVAEHRVWINQGELLIIPQSKDEDSKFLSMPQALEAIRGPREALLHSTLVEEEAFFRLRNYPAQIEQNMHHALMKIPRRLAFILQHLPASISSAIEAFYLRDPIALRPLGEDSVKALTFPPEDFVTARIKFPRVGYAQVRSQRFTTAGVWAGVYAEHADRLDAAQKMHVEIGIKVASGFEMLVSDPQKQDDSTVRGIKILFEDLEKGDESLPTDAEIRSWGTTEDDDSWMDIDFEDFERELGGGGKGRSEAGGKSRRGRGFGDKAAQENLQKLVSRFEEFLNADGLAEDSDDDEDDDEDEAISDDELIEGEDKDASFTEDEFTALMREMMGMPEETMREVMGRDAVKATGLGAGDHPDFTKDAHAQGLEERMAKLFQDLDGAVAAAEQKSKAKGKQRVEAEDDDDDDDGDEVDEDEIKHLSALMEAELRKSGALDLSESITAPDKGKGKQKPPARIKEEDDNDEEEEEDEGDSDEDAHLDDNFNLVANMLRSYKGQAGTAGPAGNLMGMMGVAMPRDEGDEDEEEDDDGRDGGHGKKGVGKWSSCI